MWTAARWRFLIALLAAFYLRCCLQTATVGNIDVAKLDINEPYVGHVPSTLKIDGGQVPTPLVNVPGYGGTVVPQRLATLQSQLFEKWNVTRIQEISDIQDRSHSLTIFYDPPYGASFNTVAGIYVRPSDPKAIIFYEQNVAEEAIIYPNMTSPVATVLQPYIQMQTPFRRYASTGAAIEPSTLRNLTLTLVAVSVHNQYWIRSKVYEIRYYVEGQARRNSTAFLVPGVQTDGWFVKFKMEMRSALRAQAAIRQELADYDTTERSPDPLTGVISIKRQRRIATGTYKQQLSLLHLTELDADLTGFDGGFPVNVTDNHGVHQFGVLVPHHNGRKFFGKVVRIDLRAMDNTSVCMDSFRMEAMNADGTINVTDIKGWKYHSGLDGQMQNGWVLHENTPQNQTLPNAKTQHHGFSHDPYACIAALDLTSLHPDARGFRKGFVGYPYAYLASGEYSVVVRLNMLNFSIATTDVIDLADIDTSLGGFSGGFTDGTWACFSPYKTFAGPVGGIRSKIPADQNRLFPYFNSRMTCINESAWTTANKTYLRDQVITVDFSTIDQQLRGFSDVLRVGRYAYFSPFKYSLDVYSGKLVRLYLGEVDIGTTIMRLQDLNARGIHDLVDVIDLSRHDYRLKGFSGLFTIGVYIFLVPFRNANEETNGQRGHGFVVRIDMNQISPVSAQLNVNLGWRGEQETVQVLNQPAISKRWKGITFLDLTAQQRTQVPNASDPDLRGFYAGFASGLYGSLVPFYNGKFSGKMARFNALANWDPDRYVDPSDVNLQELDFQQDRDRPYTYKGFQGGFSYIGNGVY